MLRDRSTLGRPLAPLALLALLALAVPACEAAASGGDAGPTAATDAGGDVGAATTDAVAGADTLGDGGATAPDGDGPDPTADAAAASDADPLPPPDAAPADAGPPDAAGDTGSDDAGPALVTQPAPPRPVSAGTCPTLVPGTNRITAAGRERGFELYLPDEPAAAPVVFLWHGVGDTARNIAAFFGASGAARRYGAIIVAPNDCCADGHQECCDQLTVWGFLPTAPLRQEIDLTLFDDIYACVSEQFDVDPRRVYTSGFSAGGLWSTFLSLNRSEYLAAAAIFSGGVGTYVRYRTAEHRLPLMLSWGGPNDTYMNGFVKFYEMMASLIAAVQADGHFVVACNHGLGHTVPSGAANWTYEFLLDHPWTNEPSPYADGTLPDAYPDYCEVLAP